MATKIVIQVATDKGVLPTGKIFAGIAVSVKDNSGAQLPAQTVNGSENPPWQASFDGTEGPNEAVATLQALDSAGNDLGDAVVLTEQGTGGIPQTFPIPTGASTITVTSV